MDAPLALCDASTLDPSDMMWTTDKVRSLSVGDLLGRLSSPKYGGGYFIRHNGGYCAELDRRSLLTMLAENMRWMYVHDQMPDEALIFRQFDNSKRTYILHSSSLTLPSAIPYGKAGCVPHTACTSTLSIAPPDSPSFLCSLRRRKEEHGEAAVKY